MMIRLLLLLVFVGVLAFVAVTIMLVIFPPWLRAFLSGAPVSTLQIIGMRLRGNPPRLIVDAHITLVHSQAATSIHEVESVYLGNKDSVRTSADLVKLVTEHVAARGAAAGVAGQLQAVAKQAVALHETLAAAVTRTPDRLRPFGSELVQKAQELADGVEMLQKKVN